MATLGESIFVAFDTETTGLFISSRVVELGAVKFRASEVLETFQSMVDPGEPIPDDATAVHGITDHQVAGQPLIAQVLPQFEVFAQDAVLVAHNAPYDIGILATEYARLRRAPLDSPVLDSCALARTARLGTSNHKLGTLAEYFGISRSAHRALADSLAVHQVFWRCLKRLRYTPETPVEEVFRAAGPPGRLTDYIEIIEKLPDRFRPLIEALEAGRSVAIRYSGGTKGIAPRVITPLAFYKANGVIYMEAEAADECQRKSFRLDRVLEVSRSTYDSM